MMRRETGLSEGCAKSTLYLAQPPGNLDPKPNYDGADTFRISDPRNSAKLHGKIQAGGQFGTVLPKDLTGDEVQQIQLKLPLAHGDVPLVVSGVHIQWTLAEGKITEGELHGVIRKQDIDQHLIPAYAQHLTYLIRRDPMSSASRRIIRVFEDVSGNPASKAKCMDTPMKFCSTPATVKTCEILPEEVRTNSLLGFAPDVQMLQDGVWNPLPKGEMKDAMSVGLGFTAVKASL